MSRRRSCPPLAAPLVAALACALAAGPALADPIAVASPELPESLPEAQREQLTSAVQDGITRGKATSVAVDTSACAGEATCIGTAAGEAGAKHALTLKVDKVESDYGVTLHILDGAGSTVVNLEESCELCGIAELEELVVDLTSRAITKLAIASKAATLAVTSEPSGASVFLDGELVGTTPFELPVGAGSRKLRIELDGYIEQERDTTLVAGERVDLELSLQPVPVAPPPEIEPASATDRGRKLRGAGYALLGLGIASAGAGIALIVIDEQPITSDCSGDNVDVDGDCKWRRNTLGGGIGLAAGGAVLIGTSIALLVKGRRRNEAPPTNARLTPTASGFRLRF